MAPAAAADPAAPAESVTAEIANAEIAKAETVTAQPTAAETVTAESATGRYLVRFAEGKSVPGEAAALRAQGIGVSRTFETAVKGAAVSATAGQVAALVKSGKAASVEPDHLATASEVQTQMQTQAPWGLDRSDQRALPLSGTYTAPSTGAGVNVYVVDSGILGSHVDFGGRVTAGWSAKNDGPGASDCNGHGTHVAGTIAGAVHGVAKSATLIPVRALGCDGKGLYSDIIAGLDWVAAHHADGVPAVVNLSIGGPGSNTLDAAIQATINDGITAVVAAGNSSVDACTTSPSRAPAALTVAASDKTDKQATFTNYGQCVDLYAPGVGIMSASHTSTTATATMQGTSMAAPHVAGAAALVLAANPRQTPAQVSDAVIAAATSGIISGTTTGTPNRLLYIAPSTAPVQDAVVPPVMTPGMFSSQAPFRQLDTRDGIGITAGAVPPGGTVHVQVTGRGGIPSSGVSAVAVNVTATQGQTAGYITAYASGTPQPKTSNLNYRANQDIPNLVIAPVGADGKVALTNTSSGTVHLIADTSGYYVSGSATAAGSYASQAPFRQLDTRDGIGITAGAVPPGGTVRVQVTGRGGIPASGVSAVAVNVTATQGQTAGYITAYASGTPQPKTSNLNYGANQDIPNLVIAPVGADGKIALTNTSSGTVHLIADTSGYYVSGSATAAGSYESQAPFRQLDTREGTGITAGTVPPGGTIRVQVTGRGGIPTSGVSAVAVNVTATQGKSAGFITAYGSGSAQPKTSNLNYLAGQDIPNYVITPVGADGKIALTNTSNNTVHLIADTSGYYR